MDTSGIYPQLGDDDPLFEIAQYTQLLRTKLESQDKAKIAHYIRSDAHSYNTGGAAGIWGPGQCFLDPTSNARYTRNWDGYADWPTGVGPTNDFMRILKDGLYSFQYRIDGNSAPPAQGEQAVWLYNTTGTSTIDTLGIAELPDYGWSAMVQTKAVYLFANDLVRFGILNISGAWNVGASRVYITRHAD